MRSIPLVLVILLLTPTFGSVAAQAPTLADEAETALLDLKAQTLYDQSPDRDPVEHLQEVLEGHSQAPPGDVTQAWRAAQNATGPDARRAILAAEAALLDHARHETQRALEDGNATLAQAWLELPLERAYWQQRALPVEPVLEGDGLDEENVTELLDSALAIRAREAIMEALLLNRTGAREEARATAQGAEALVATLIPEASSRLPDALRDPLEGNATGIAQAVLAVPNGTSDHFLTGLIAPLTALEYNHRIEVLEEFGARNIDPAFVVARAASEDPDQSRALAQAAFERYAADRARLGVMGEGTAEGIDDAYRALLEAQEQGSPEAVLEAAGAVRGAVAEVALLDPGFTLKVETGGVQPNRTHKYHVAFLRPTLEGIASYEIEIGYNASVVETVDVTTADAEHELTSTLEPGVARLEGSFDPSLVSNVRLVLLHLEARGPPASETDLTIEEATFREPDGDRMDPFILRDGHVTTAQIETGEDEASPEAAADGNATTQQTPWGVFATLLALLAAVQIAPRWRR